MWNKLKWRLKVGGGHIFKSFGISLVRARPPHAVSLLVALFVYIHSDSFMQ